MEIAIIQNKILEIRQQKVLLDRDLAEMYGVQTRDLNKAVKRNIARFRGEDFMFQISKEEFATLKLQFVNSEENLMFQNGTSSWGGTRKLPYAFTELGVAMLSSVLNSATAIEVNRNIMRAFVMLRQFALNYAELNHKLDDFMMETKMKFSEVYQALTELMEQKKIAEKPRRRIGYVNYDNENEINMQ